MCLKNLSLFANLFYISTLKTFTKSIKAQCISLLDLIRMLHLKGFDSAEWIGLCSGFSYWCCQLIPVFIVTSNVTVCCHCFKNNENKYYLTWQSKSEGLGFALAPCRNMLISNSLASIWNFFCPCVWLCLSLSFGHWYCQPLCSGP